MTPWKTGHFRSGTCRVRSTVAGICALLALGCSPATAGQPPAQSGSPPATEAPSELTAVRAADLLLEGKWEEGLAAYETLSAKEPASEEALLGRARCLERLGRYAESLETLDTGGLLASPQAHVLRAEVCALLGDYVESLKLARTAIELDAENAAARLHVARTLELLGRREEAIEAYRWFDRQLVERTDLPKDAAWLTQVAQGFLRFSVLTRTNVRQRSQHSLVQLLQMAYERVDRHYWPARIAAADLLREKYNNDENDGSVSDYRAALRINPRLPEAFVGLGEVALERWDFEQVEQRVSEALAVNPRFAPALHLKARLRLVERRYAQAREVCDEALNTNPRDVTALALRAAASACLDDHDEVEAIRRRVAEINPRCAVFYRTLADALGGIRRFPAAEAHYLRAIEFDDTDANARTELGMMYMQWGREDRARELLEGAWDLDAFNERTKFTLELLESLQGFARVETQHFIVRHDAEQDPGLGAFLGDMLEEVYKSVTADYGFEPPDKTIVEVFPSLRAFGVRISGRPWIHTVGACTGRVIALASPRSSPKLMGPYNVARVLTHEFTHTVTLAATENRIPHWLTEGLAVLQEGAPRSFEWTELLTDAIRRDALFTLESIDWGFMRPRRPTDRPMAYAQSEWMCEFIIERFGYDRIDALLKALKEGQKQDEALKSLLGLTTQEFDEQFARWAREQARPWGFDLTPRRSAEALRTEATERDDAATWGLLAEAELSAGNEQEALAAARRTLEIDAAEPRALEVLGEVLARVAERDGGEAGRRSREDEALAALAKLLEFDADNWTALKRRGQVFLRRQDWERAAEDFQSLQRVCPRDPASWRGLAGIYLKQGQNDLALVQLLELARVEEHDADVPGEIGRIYREQGRPHDARYWFRNALWIDPFRAKYHESLGQVCLELGDTKSALSSFVMLTSLEPRNATRWVDAAVAAHKLGDAASAQRLARQALDLDPQAEVRSILP